MRTLRRAADQRLETALHGVSGGLEPRDDATAQAITQRASQVQAGRSDERAADARIAPGQGPLMPVGLHRAPPLV